MVFGQAYCEAGKDFIIPVVGCIVQAVRQPSLSGPAMHEPLPAYQLHEPQRPA